MYEYWNCVLFEWFVCDCGGKAWTGEGLWGAGQNSANTHTVHNTPHQYPQKHTANTSPKHKCTPSALYVNFAFYPTFRVFHMFVLGRILSQRAFFSKSSLGVESGTSGALYVFVWNNRLFLQNKTPSFRTTTRRFLSIRAWFPVSTFEKQTYLSFFVNSLRRLCLLWALWGLRRRGSEGCVPSKKSISTKTFHAIVTKRFSWEKPTDYTWVIWFKTRCILWNPCWIRFINSLQEILWFSYS